MSTVYPDPEPHRRRKGDSESKYQWAIDGLKQLGIPVVFAAVLLWFVLSRVDDTLKDISSTLHLHNSNAITQAKTLEDNTGETKTIMLSIERLNQRVCFNTAKTNIERNECYK